MRFDRDSKAEYLPPIFAYREMSQRHKSLQGLVCSYRIFSEMKENIVMIHITRIESQRDCLYVVKISAVYSRCHINLPQH